MSAKHLLLGKNSKWLIKSEVDLPKFTLKCIGNNSEFRSIHEIAELLEDKDLD